MEFWNRASESDINDWGELGNEGWSWESLLPYFLKIEDFIQPPKKEAHDLDISYIDPKYHGTKGPIKVSYPTEYGTFQAAWNPTFHNLGLEVTGDPFNGRAIGGFTLPISQNPKTVTRSYAANAYYKPNAARPNLKVITNALVNNVVFKDRKSPKLVASGLNFTFNGKHHVVRARREVILSAGVVQSPQLLELSGIGSAALLKSLGIKVRIDNPHVGENLQDHQETSLGFEAADGLVTFSSLGNPAVFGAALEQYNTNRTGLLTEAACSTSLLSYAQILKSSKSANLLPADEKYFRPSEEELKKNPGLAKQYELIARKLLNPNEATVQQAFLPAGSNYRHVDNSTLLFSSPGPGSFVTLFGLALHPFSRGSIHINSANPTIYPIINPRYLSNPLDVDVLSTVAFHLQTIASTQPFASLLKNNGTVYEIGYERLTPANIKQHVRSTINSIYHGIGTCAMEPRDKGGVVDARLKVYGTSNLRVVDASVVPLATRGTIQSLVYAIAEKAADMIKEDSGRYGSG